MGRDRTWEGNLKSGNTFTSVTEFCKKQRHDNIKSSKWLKNGADKDVLTDAFQMDFNIQKCLHLNVLFPWSISVL